MGRGRGGSGGRSSGGHSHSSSRSSGGRMRSSGRGGSSFSSSSHRGGGGYSSRSSYGGSHYHYHSGPGGYCRPYSRSSGMGCLTQIIVFLFIIFLLFFIAAVVSSGFGSITPSTVEREPLSMGSVVMTDFYTDELDWIRSGTKLEKGMRQFLKKTGVQPYLYITDTVNGTVNPSSSDMEEYAAELYDDLFTDEGHFLLLFHEYNSSGNYNMWYTCGAQAKTVMDKEACDILMDYVDKYYYSDLSEDELFSKAFEESADRIMTVAKSPMPTIIISIVVVVGIFIAFSWWKKAKAQKNLEAEQMERILNADLHTMSGQSSGSSADDLESKYR